MYRGGPAFDTLAGWIAFVCAAMIPAVVFVGLVRAADPPKALPCNLTSGAQQSVVGVEDARTLVLDDGGKIRLSGILPFGSPSVTARVSMSDREPTRSLQGQAVSALKRLVVGRSVVLAFVDPKHDRFGNLQAHVFVSGAGTSPENSSPAVRRDSKTTLTWVQGDLLTGGLVRAYEPRGQSDCFAELMALQREAWQNRTGLWARPEFGALAAEKTARVLKRRGKYERVVGRIRAVAHRGAVTYLNFGENWRTDFTIVVPRHVQRAHREWAKTLSSLEGKTVEVQGWIVSRNGPNVELEHPAQLGLDSGFLDSRARR